MTIYSTSYLSKQNKDLTFILTTYLCIYPHASTGPSDCHRPRYIHTRSAPTENTWPHSFHSWTHLSTDNTYGRPFYSLGTPYPPHHPQDPPGRLGVCRRVPLQSGVSPMDAKSGRRGTAADQRWPLQGTGYSRLGARQYLKQLSWLGQSSARGLHLIFNMFFFLWHNCLADNRTFLEQFCASFPNQVLFLFYDELRGVGLGKCA